MMKALTVSTMVVCAGAALLANMDFRGGAPWRVSQFENVLGTSMEFKVVAASEAIADAAEAAALAEIRRLNGILSGYDAASEFSRWSARRGEAVRVSPELHEVLSLWEQWTARSGGALNPAAEAISRVWNAAAKQNRMPAAADLAAAVVAAQAPQWKLDAETATRLTDTPVRLNSFTKSYVVERAAEAAMATAGVSAVVVNIGGDLVVRGTASDFVSIANPHSDAENSAPLAELKVRDRAVATSGNYRRGFEIGGQHYSHIVDPRTGQTAEEIASATVVARDAVDAGALATAMSVLSPADGHKLAATVPDAEFLLVRHDGTQIASNGWNKLVSPRVPALAAAAATDAAAWNAAYELTVNVEIPQVQGFGARRPYVAVWVEDKDRFPVKTLALWFNNTRWLSDLRGWYRDDRLRAMSEGSEILNSVSSATRSPGKYTFKWDGKDNAGKPVKAGRYTVLVEAAREHGGYNIVKHAFEVNGAPAQAQSAAEGELGPVSIDYHKAAR